MTDTTIRIGSRTYNVVVYYADDTGGWRAEAAYSGRVVEVVDTGNERDAWSGMRRVLERRNRTQ